MSGSSAGKPGGNGATAVRSPREIVDACLDRIAATEPLVNAFISTTPDLARVDADRIERLRARGNDLPLDGMPIGVKDNIDVAGANTTLACRAYSDRGSAAADAEVVRRLRAAGAVVIGKTNMHELAFGATTTNPPPFGVCHNPWDTERISGGSSGGSAVALAVDACAGALGTDTGGSIRIPAALNGVTGLRPTYGQVSTRGTFALSRSFDVVGPMARSAANLALLFEVISGFDREDPRAAVAPEPGASASVKHLRVGIPRTYFFDGIDAGVATLVLGFAETLADLGAAVVKIDLPMTDEILQATATILTTEAYALHRRRLHMDPDLFGEQVRERMETAEQFKPWDVTEAIDLQFRWKQQLRRVFAEVDAIVCPTTSRPAPLIADVEGDTSEASRELCRFTYPWSFAQVPALSLPCGFAAAGLPVGAQLVGPPGSDRMLLAAGVAYQEATSWHLARPEVLIGSSLSSQPRRSGGGDRDG